MCWLESWETGTWKTYPFLLLSPGLEFRADGGDGVRWKHLRGVGEDGGFFEVNVRGVDALEFGGGGEELGLFGGGESGGVDPLPTEGFDLVVEEFVVAVVGFEMGEIVEG